MSKSPGSHPELSHLIRFSEVGDDVLNVTIDANAAELKAVCARLGILDVRCIKSNVRLQWVDAATLTLSDADQEIEGDILRLDAELEAEVTQECVLTLEPVEASIRHKFTRHFGEGHRRDLPEEPIELEIFEGASRFAQIEIVPEGRIDVGEIVTEELALSLDPYPRAEGVTLEGELQEGGHDDVGTSEDTVSPDESPFSVLGALKEELERKE